jgi:hypothetical protein
MRTTRNFLHSAPSFLLVRWNFLRTVPVCLLLLVTGGACKKNNIANTSSGDIFPDKVGDHWHYLVKDTTEGLHDTSSVQYGVDVDIVGTTISPGGVVAYIWKITYPNGADTNMLFQYGDTLNYVELANSPRHSFQPFGTYIVPFATGATWAYVYGMQKIAVIGQEDIVVGNDRYKGAWEIRGSAGMPDGIFRIDEWYADHIGCVRRYYNPYGELIITKHVLDWNLVSYQLK